MKGKIRLFVAVTPPNAIIVYLKEVQKKLKSYDSKRAVKWVKSDSMHITLKFIGETDPDKADGIISAVEKSLKNVERFEIKTGKIVIFPNTNKPRIAAVEIFGTTLESCADKISNSLTPFGIKKDRRRFRGHITLGRVKKKLKNSLKTDVIMEEKIFEVDGIKIVESILKPQGAEYITLKRIMLN